MSGIHRTRLVPGEKGGRLRSVVGLLRINKQLQMQLNWSISTPLLPNNTLAVVGTVPVSESFTRFKNLERISK